ncbi:MAG: thioredoxin family protein, partial [Actinomycetota bacterium]
DRVRLESLDQLMDLVASGRPVFVDFWQQNCQSCRTMDGIVNELAEEYEERAVVVKANAAEAPDAFQKFNVRGTPTFLILTSADDERSRAVHQRYRATGLVRKDILTQNLDRAVEAVP